MVTNLDFFKFADDIALITDDVNLADTLIKKTRRGTRKNCISTEIQAFITDIEIKITSKDGTYLK